MPDDAIDYWKQKKEGEYQMHRDSIDAYDVVEFSEDITQIVNTQGTITVGCIQIAVYPILNSGILPWNQHTEMHQLPVFLKTLY